MWEQRDWLVVVTKESKEIEEKRARRAERRQKQRDANETRAAKMHELRVGAPQVDVSNLRGDRQVLIGCSGWYYWHWLGRFYPQDIPKSDWFSYYQRQFQTVELNAPFYSWPTATAVKTWLRQAEGDFLYSVKVCELITHIKRFEKTEELVKDFSYIAGVLGERMGCFLFQLPPSVHYSQQVLERILRQLDPRYRNVIEFRHKSWWNDDVFRKFEKARAIFCSTSGPRLPDRLIRTADDIYIRFHGTNQWYRHDYSDEELLKWAERIQASGAKRAWVYFNNDRDGNAIKNAKALMAMVADGGRSL